MSIGFQEAGFEILLFNDVELDSAETHAINFHKVPFILKDISTIKENDLRSIIGDNEIDVMIGGPPCQGFSNMGDKAACDPRNQLFDSYIRIVKWIKPKCVLIENVVGIKTLYGGVFFNKICDSLSLIGYDVYAKILDSSEYGVPQIRKRMFIFCTRIDGYFCFPSPRFTRIGNLIPALTVGDAIMDLVGKDEGFQNHAPLNHSEKVIARYKLIPEGGKLPPKDKLPPDIRRENFGNTYVRLDRSKPSSTMVPGNNAFPVHPTLNRSLTPREAARLQSFPDDHIFFGTRAKQCHLVGNAVPPLLAAHLGVTIKDYLHGILKAPSINDLSYLMCKKGEGFKHKSIMSKNRKETLTFVDLFSGVGGFCQGFKQAGLIPLLSVDNNYFAAESHNLNHPDVPFIMGDLSENTVQNKIMKILNGKKVDILVGGPPCQGFSIFGSRRFVNSKNYNPLSDNRNDLIKIFWKYVDLLKPDWVVMENVPGFVSLLDGYYYREAVNMARGLGYRIEDNVLNAADYGVPQLRKRFLMIATRTKYVIPWPKAKYYEYPRDWQKPYRTIGEVLTDLSDKATYDKYPNHCPPKHNKIVAERFSYIKEGKRLDPNDLPPRLSNGVKTGRAVKNFSHIFRRLDRNKPARTMVPGHNAFPVHPWLNRTLTIREVARIQTFPDQYVFVGPIIEQGLQVGNAFPCLLAQHLAERLLRVVRNKWTRDSITDLAAYSMIAKEK